MLENHSYNINRKKCKQLTDSKKLVHNLSARVRYVYLLNNDIIVLKLVVQLPFLKKRCQLGGRLKT